MTSGLAIENKTDKQTEIAFGEISSFFGIKSVFDC